MTRAQFREMLAEELGEAFAFSYFDRSNFTDTLPPKLNAWSGPAHECFKTRAHAFLKKHGVILGPPLVPGTWRDGGIVSTKAIAPPKGRQPRKPRNPAEPESEMDL